MVPKSEGETNECPGDNPPSRGDLKSTSSLRKQMVRGHRHDTAHTSRLVAHEATLQTRPSRRGLGSRAAGAYALFDGVQLRPCSNRATGDWSCGIRLSDPSCATSPCGCVRKPPGRCMQSWGRTTATKVWDHPTASPVPYTGPNLANPRPS
jgi:hypothetical protein